MKGLLILLVIAALLVSGCTSTVNAPPAGDKCDGITCRAVSDTESNQGGQLTPVADKVEVFHFHGTHQCYSCITVGSLAEKTVNTYFKDELDSGKIVFGHINGELPENSDLVAKYGVTSASLWIGTYINGTFHKEENVNVWYKISNEADYLQYLKGIIEKRLKGVLE